MGAITAPGAFSQASIGTTCASSPGVHGLKANAILVLQVPKSMAATIFTESIIKLASFGATPRTRFLYNFQCNN